MKILPFDQGATFMQTQTSTAGRVFVSYSRKDSGFAQVLTDALLARGFEAYLDVKDIAPGEPWQERLAQLIRSADTVVFLVSPDSVKSDICEWETTEAKSLEKRILPVVHRRVEDGQVPETLSRLNFIFMDDAAAFGPQLDVLVSALQTDLAWVREHTRLAELARSWDAQGKRNTDLLRGPSIERAEAWIASRPADAPMPTDIHRAFIAGSRQLKTRNQRNLVTGSIGAAVVFGGVALYAVEQRNSAKSAELIAIKERETAQTERNNAQTNLNISKTTSFEMATSLMSNILSNVEISPSTTKSIISIIDKSLESIEKISPNDILVATSRIRQISSKIDVFSRQGDRLSLFNVIAEADELTDKYSKIKMPYNAFMQQIHGLKMKVFQSRFSNERKPKINEINEHIEIIINNLQKISKITNITQEKLILNFDTANSYVIFSNILSKFGFFNESEINLKLASINEIQITPDRNLERLEFAHDLVFINNSIKSGNTNGMSASIKKLTKNINKNFQEDFNSDIYNLAEIILIYDIAINEKLGIFNDSDKILFLKQIVDISQKVKKIQTERSTFSIAIIGYSSKLASKYIDLGDYENCKKYFKIAIEYSSNFDYDNQTEEFKEQIFNDNNSLGYCMILSGEPENSLKYIEKAILLAPNDKLKIYPITNKIFYFAINNKLNELLDFIQKNKHTITKEPNIYGMINDDLDLGVQKNILSQTIKDEIMTFIFRAIRSHF